MRSLIRSRSFSLNTLIDIERSIESKFLVLFLPQKPYRTSQLLISEYIQIKKYWLEHRYGYCKQSRTVDRPRWNYFDNSDLSFSGVWFNRTIMVSEIHWQFISFRTLFVVKPYKTFFPHSTPMCSFMINCIYKLLPLFKGRLYNLSTNS